MPRHPRFHTGDRERARGLEDGAGVLEDVLQRRADRVGVDEHDLVDVLLHETKRLLADLLHRDPVGEQADMGEPDPATCGERARHRIRVLGLDSDHPDLGPHPLHVGGDAARQSAAADGDEDRVDGSLALAQDLHADRTLPRDDVRIIVGVHEHGARSLLQHERMRIRVAVRIAEQHRFRAPRLDGGDLDVRRGHRHHDRRRAIELLRGERDTLRVVAGRGRDDAARALGGRQMRHLVVRAAQLEREHRLLVLALEEQAVAEPARQRRGEFERRLDRDVVDLRGQDLL